MAAVFKKSNSRLIKIPDENSSTFDDGKSYSLTEEEKKLDMQETPGKNSHENKFQNHIKELNQHVLGINQELKEKILKEHQIT